MKDNTGAVMPAQHLSFEETKTFIISIAQCISIDLLKFIQKSKYIGIMIDESSDCSGNEMLVLYIEFLCRVEHKFKNCLFNNLSLKT